jgi:hypothetical protein
MDRLKGADAAEIDEAITVLALGHRLMSRFTSFVVVDRSEVREDGELVTIDQPLPMPEGVSYEGVFGEADAGRDRMASIAPVAAKMASPQVFAVSQVRFKPPAPQPTGAPARPAPMPVPDPTPLDPEPAVFHSDSMVVSSVPVASVESNLDKEARRANTAEMGAEVEEVREAEVEQPPTEVTAPEPIHLEPHPQPSITIAQPETSAAPGTTAGVWALRLGILTLLTFSGILLVRHVLLRPAS